MPTSPRKFALLLYLAVERGRRIPRSVLQELIFSDQAEKNGRHSLRELFYQLRQMGVELNASSDGVQLSASDVEVDYDAITSAESMGSAYTRAALGGFLPGFAPTHSEAYAEWYEAYRAQSISSLSRAFLKEINRARNSGEWEITERTARACLAIDPLNETATLALAEMLVLAGGKAKAVQLLAEFMDEVGRTSPDLKIPARTLRRRIDQVSDHSTPRLIPRFVGRSEEMNALRSLLRRTCRGEANLVIVSGEPGIGKTRLLSEFRSLLEFEGSRSESVSMQPQDLYRPMGAFVDLVP